LSGAIGTPAEFVDQIEIVTFAVVGADPVAGFKPMVSLLGATPFGKTVTLGLLLLLNSRQLCCSVGCKGLFVRMLDFVRLSP
jgi:hypothetical protein